MMSSLSDSFQSQYSIFQAEFEKRARKRFDDKAQELKQYIEKDSMDTSFRILLSSMEYSFFTGGKRFRPVIGSAVGRLFGRSGENIFPWLLAIEMIHTYSLVHDDLPCMDNDNERRGMPTNHIQFDEATALLAGDALLTDAFGEVAAIEPAGAVKKLIRILSRDAGLFGMITGQVMDIQFEKTFAANHSSDELLKILEQIHQFKTAKLIQLACVGPAVIADCHSDVLSQVEKFGLLLGFSFQVADDFLDADQNEQQNMVSLVGPERCRRILDDLTKQCVGSLNTLCEVLEKVNSPEHLFLSHLIEFNLQRKK